MSLLKKNYPASVLLSVSLFFQLNVFAQSAIVPTLKAPIPPSPDAASLGKYGDVPVSLFTGMVDISIPLLNVKGRVLSLPVGLSYHSSGIKVDDVAGWVGLGWSLNAGGVITRSVRGKADDNSYLIDNYLTIEDAPGISQLVDFSYYNDLVDNIADNISDVYYFNFAGHSGKFYFDQHQRIIHNGDEQLRIERVSSTRFDITTADGTTYVFGTNRANTNQCTETSSLPAQIGGDTYISSWYLAEIISPFNNDLIEFFYQSYVGQQVLFDSEQSNTYYPNLGSPCMGDEWDYGTTHTLTILGVKRLDEIRFNDGIVKFISSNTRTDVYTGDYRYKLDAVELRDKQNVLKKRFQLTYSYYNPSSTNAQRLKLTDVTESGADNVNQPPYHIDYDETVPLPLLRSKAQDHWGFYNGRTSNDASLHNIPPYNYNGTLLPGTNREAGEAKYTKAGMIQKITYPTKGYTIFEFEPHDIGGGTGPEQVTRSVNTRTDINAGVFTGSITFTPANNTYGDFTFMRPSRDYLSANDIRCTPVFKITNLTTGVDLNITPTFTGAQEQLFVNNVSLVGGNQYRLQVQESDTRCGQNLSAAEKDRLNTYLLVSYKELTGGQVPIPKTLVGGVRIKRIVDNDGISNSKARSFKYEIVPGASSGELLDMPVYAYSYKMYRSSDNPHEIPECPSVGCPAVIRSSSSRSVLGATHGSHIAYPSVETDYEDASGPTAMGKTIQKYSMILDPGNHNEFPFQPESSYEWYRGRLTSQQDYNAANVKVHEIINSYTHETIKDFKFMKIGKAYGGGNHRTCLNPAQFIMTFGAPGDVDWFKLAPYYVFLRWSRLDSTEERFYDGNQYLKTTKVLTFGNASHRQVTKQTVVDSKGNEITTEYKYPGDYSTFTCDRDAIENTFETTVDQIRATKTQTLRDIRATTSSDVSNQLSACRNNANTAYFQAKGARLQALTNYATCIANYISNTPDQQNKSLATLQQKNVLNQVVETFETVKLNNVPYLTRAYKNNFKLQVPGQVVVDYVSRTNLTTPLLKSAFDANPSAFYQKEYEFNSYDNNSNVLEQTTAGGIKASFIWSYNNAYPVAEVSNGAVANIAYTSFEAEGNGSWSFTNTPVTDNAAITGDKILNLSSSSLTKTGLTSTKTYIVSYWTKNTAAFTVSGTQGTPVQGRSSGNWRYFEHRVAAQTEVAISGTGAIDEVRLYPENARMVTYTYTPMYGITSKCDENNTVSYFEYDSMGRLKIVRDQNGMILKIYDYKLGRPLAE